MSLLWPIRGKTDDLGPLLRLPCSQCEEIRWFHLKRHSASARILGIDLSKSSSCSLHCAKCEYAFDVTEEDVGKAIPFLSVAQQFATGKIDESDFRVKLECVGFAFLQKLAAANTSWTCPKCGEESPLTLAVCWKCGEMRDGVHEPSDDDSPKTPYLDQFLKNEGGPFGPLEQLKMTEATRPFKVDLVTQSDAGVYGLVLNEFGPWEPPVVEENLEKLAQRVCDCVTAIVRRFRV